MTRVIGIYGKARSGKTTARRCLERYAALPLSFADALKSSVNTLFNVPLEELYSDKKSERTRWILQFFGTDCCRHIDPLVWVKKTSDKILELSLDGAALVVIDDVRFLNEAEMLKNDWNATLVKLVGPEDLVTNEEHKKHVSETQMDNVPEAYYDAVYRNTGTLEDLSKFMDAVYHMAMGPIV